MKTSRRDFLIAGSTGLAGLSLADLLRAESAAGVGHSNRAVINIHLDGGPPQLDTWDLKPHAPVEIRGEFQPIETTLPGVHVCELLPKMAGMAEKLVFLRSLVGSAGRHDAFQCQSGFSGKDLESLGGRPAMGSVVTYLKGSPEDRAPAFVDLMQGRPLVRDSARPGFLGPAFQPFRPDISHLFERELEAGMKKELARQGAGHSVSLTLHPSLTVHRLNERMELMRDLDRVRRTLDTSGTMDAMDRFTQQAVGILTSGQFAAAMDLDHEDPRVVERYTMPAREDAFAERSYTSDHPKATLKFLLARRLVEAGVRCVSISLSDFDTHSKNFPRMRQLLPILDHGLHALLTDLEERGMTQDVTIVAWGEFGRTPRIDPKNGGRHHWPQVGPALLAGGRLRTGQVIGATDRTASVATERPVTYKDVFATLYHSLGIDPHAVTIPDTQGRPQYLLDEGAPIREVI